MTRVLPTSVAVAVAAVLAGCASTPAEDDPVQTKLNDLDARVARIERVVSNQSLVQLAQNLDSVQAETRRLRGRIEELENSNETLKKQVASGAAARGNGARGSTARHLLLQGLVTVLELLDAPAQSARLGLNRIEVLCQLHQALVRHHALDTRDTGIEIVELGLNRVIFRRSRGAPGEYRSDCNGDGSGQHSGHGSLPLRLNYGRPAARGEIHDFDAPVLCPCGFVTACDSGPLGAIAHRSKLSHGVTTCYGELWRGAARCRRQCRSR